jgi:hypothetical protein
LPGKVFKTVQATTQDSETRERHERQTVAPNRRF